jgi:hypothetical protein
LDILPKTLYHWYRNPISDYLPDKEKGCWHPNTLITADEETGEIIKKQSLLSGKIKKQLFFICKLQIMRRHIFNFQK